MLLQLVVQPFHVGGIVTRQDSFSGVHHRFVVLLVLVPFRVLVLKPQHMAEFMYRTPLALASFFRRKREIKAIQGDISKNWVNAACGELLYLLYRDFPMIEHEAADLRLEA